MTDFGQFSDIGRLLQTARARGMPLDPESELGREQAKLDRVLSRLAYLRFPDAYKAMAENPGGSESRAQLLAIAEEAAQHIRDVVAMYGPSGID